MLKNRKRPGRCRPDHAEHCQKGKKVTANRLLDILN